MDINDVIGILAPRIIVPFRLPLAEFVALMDVICMFHKEETVVNDVCRDGRVQSKGAV